MTREGARAFGCVALALLGCGSHAPTEHARPAAVCVPGDTAGAGDPLVSLACIARGVWVFTASGVPLGAPASDTITFVPANGLLVEAGDHAVLVDTAWTDDQADELARFAAARGLPIRAALVTHFHEDRTGGVRALIARGVPVFATAETLALAESTGRPVPDHVLAEDSIPELRWLFPGAAHSADNVVVFHPASRTLFGGCMIKEVGAETLGNVADADLDAWPGALTSLRATYPDVALVVPGHGSVGGPELITHTASLLGMDECGSDADCVVSIAPLEPCSCCGCVEPRALPRVRAERLGELAQMSCQPICDHAVCAACAPQQALLPRLRGACLDALCTAVPIE